MRIDFDVIYFECRDDNVPNEYDCGTVILAITFYRSLFVVSFVTGQGPWGRTGIEGNVCGM